jgi:hypothetical protein
MNKTLYRNIEKVKIAELTFLEEIFGNQSKVASLLNVKRSSITRWHKGEKPDGTNLIKLAGLTYVVTKLMTFFRNQESALAWLKGTNAHLRDQVPMDLLKSGHINEVSDAVDQYLAGSYA